MRVKVVAIALLLFDVVLFIFAGLYLAESPGSKATKQEIAQFVLRSYSVVAVLLVSLLITVIVVFAWVRAIRDEYRHQLRENVKNLFETSLQDHGEKPA